MKCKKCRREMKRIKLDQHRYIYRCACGYEVGKAENKEGKKDNA